MKKQIKLPGIVALVALIVIMAACYNGMVEKPGIFSPIPIAADYDIGNLNQMVGDVTAVTITPKPGKSPGERTIYYTGTESTTYAKSTDVPSAVGTYAVTFDVAAATGWKAAAGLEAGTLVIGDPNLSTPKADDYVIYNLNQTVGDVIAVTVTPKPGKSPGDRTIYYTGIEDTIYDRSTDVPFAAGTYAVTFDVAAADGWNPASMLEAGILTITSTGGGPTYTVTFDKNGGDTDASPTTRTVASPATTVGTLPIPPAWTGYIFDGWNTEANGSGTEFIETTPVTKSITVYAQWVDTASASGNANIREVSGTGANALYGLYIAGSPGISNGDPQPTDASDFTDHTSAIWGNYTLADPANNRSIVVIVEDKKVSKVEFGITDNVTSAPTSVTLPDSWVDLTRNSEYTTTDTESRRWTGTLTSPSFPSASSYRQVYVRITAQNGAVQVYRYVQYISATAPSGSNAARGELNSLSIGGVNVVTSAADAGTNKRGTYAGWWNKTVAPEIEAGEVTLTTAQAANGAISATFCFSNAQEGSTVSYAKIPAADWPLKEGSVAFTELTTTTSTNIVGTGTISGIANGDYIILRRNPPSSDTYKGYYGHYIIKVNVEDSYTVTFDKNGGDTDASPASIKVTSPAATVGTLPATAPTRTGYSFTGWNTAANGSGSAFTTTTPVTADITVYAQWSPYTLSIGYANGGGIGSAPTSPITAKYGDNVTMPANTYTREGYNFAGWAVSGTGSTAGTYAAGASVAVSALSTAIATANASITLTATWSDVPVVLSSNANIRTVSGDGANKLYGLYIGGMPGISNGTPRSDATGFSSSSEATLSGNNPTANPDRNVVVIVEDAKVSKVEFGVNSGGTGTSLSDTAAPSTWYTLTKNNEYTTPDTVDKRWAGKLTVAAPTSSSSRGFYVRITAEDGTTQQVYRYHQYISTTVGTNVTRGELTALTIGTVAVINNGNVQGSHSKGIATGWWNKTVAPDFTPGEVTITAAQAASCAVSATVNNAATGVNLSFAKISGSQWPLLENSAVTFGTASSNTTGTTTFTNVANGDYIVIRQNAGTAADYKALFSHYIIKVNVTN